MHDLHTVYLHVSSVFIHILFVTGLILYFTLTMLVGMKNLRKIYFLSDFVEIKFQNLIIKGFLSRLLIFGLKEKIENIIKIIKTLINRLNIERKFKGIISPITNPKKIKISGPIIR